MLFNIAPRYREAIYKAIDDRWDTEWFFGSNSTDIKGLDCNILSNHTILSNKRLGISHWYWQKKALGLVKNKDYSTYFLAGDPFCLSSWLIGLSIKLFYRDKKLYFWTHGWYGKESKLVKVIKKLFFKLADGIFLYGNYAKKLMISEGFDETKLHVIHNSLNYSQQLVIRESLNNTNIYRDYFKNDFPTLIFIGRLTEVKRIDLLLCAVDNLKKKGLYLNIALIGDGSASNNLRHLANKLNIMDNIWFYGACYDESKNAELIYNATLCVAPGNVGLTAMHSMVFGTPVLSHDDFKLQMPEFEAVNPGKTGAFFKRDDLSDLTLKIEDWIMQHSNRELVRKECYAEIENNWTPDFQMRVLESNLDV